ncbi:ATP-binding cassette domain-containing protein [Amylibacter sp.]|nr:ATP-binding cassette domain-containing protein [Amylibacter sp.]
MITVQNLHKKFAANTVLNGVDVQIEKGQSMAIIGGSGTGKSVLLKCILGLETHDSGKIFINGEESSKLDKNKFLSNFGMLFQNAALFDSLSVWKNVAFRLTQGPNKIPEKQAKDIAIASYREGEAAIVAPMQYSQIIWASIFGYFLFDEKISTSVIAGATIIILSGLYIVVRESGSNSENTPVLRTRSRELGSGLRVGAMLRAIRRR